MSFFDVYDDAAPPPDEPAPTVDPALHVVGEDDTSWDRSVPGGAFILDQPETVPAVWGDAENVLWSEGEPCMLVGPAGAGKTTVAQQVVLARLGLRDSMLGLPVAPTSGRVLYLACDRPAQIARSFRRMVDDLDREQLDERLIVWRGPLPFDLGTEPRRLAQMAKHFGADTVVVDSLKDVEPALETSEGGSRTNQALQECVAQGVEVLVIHHQRKAQSDNRRPKSLSDVYGSTWLTAGAGSVVLIWGEPGDPVVELSHLKQPLAEVGPWTLLHDHDRGSTTVEQKPDVLALVQSYGSKGLTARDAACHLFATNDPTRAQVQKATRRLQKLEGTHLYKKPGSKGGAGGSIPDTYYPLSREDQP